MPIILDIETFPIADAEQYCPLLETIDPPDLDAITPAKNLVDPAKIAADIAKRKQAAVDDHVAQLAALAAKRQQWIDNCATDPDLLKIVALGWMLATDHKPTVRVCQGDTDERDMLEGFWRDYTAADEPTLITFFGLKFDIPALLRRSLYLRVPHPAINLDRYRTPHIDLFNRLTFNGAIQGHTLKLYLSRFGISNDDLTSGKDIAALVKAGDWTAVAAHCASDVMATKQLAERIGAIRVLQEATGAF